MAERSANIPSLLTPYRDYLPDGRVKDSMDIHESIEALKGAMKNVSKRVIGRDRLAEQTLLALLSGEHQLIFSRTGTAKSLYGKTVFGQFEAETFFIQLTKGTTEEALVGAYDLNKFREGSIWHDTQGSLVTADFAFLDEFYDANDMVLRSMLGILNEREFSKGKQYQPARLHTAIAVTNYLRKTDVSEAIMDRFLFQSQLGVGSTEMGEMLVDGVYGRHNGNVVTPYRKLPLAVLKDLSSAVKGEQADNQVTASYASLFLKNQVIRKYAELVTGERRAKDSKAAEVYISPRTIAKCREVLNASALLNHRFEVTGDDLAALRFVITTIAGDGRQVDPKSGVINEEDVFFKAVDSTLSTFKKEDLDQVEKIMTINEYVQAYRDGVQIEALKNLRPRFLQTILLWLGITNWQDVTLDTFRTTLIGISPRNKVISGMRDELVATIDQDAKRN